MPQKIKGGLEVGKDLKVGNVFLDPSLTTTDRTVQFPDAAGTAVLTSAALTQGSIPFVGSTTSLDQDNSNLFYDNTNNRLGVQNNVPSATLDISTDPNWTIGTSPTPTAVASDTGGTVTAGTYYFKIVATFRGGSAAAGTQSNAATVTTSTGSIALSWTGVAGANTYLIYRTTTSGTYTTPTFLTTTTNTSFTWTSGTVLSGTPSTTASQNVYSGRFWLNDLYTTTGTGYGTATVNAVSALTANNADLRESLRVFQTIPADNTYNHGASRALRAANTFSGSGTVGAGVGALINSTYQGRGSTVGSFTGVSTTATYTGSNTITMASLTGTFSSASLTSAGRATNIYGAQTSASLSSGNGANPTAGSVYALRSDSTHSATGTTTDAMYGVYGTTNTTGTGATTTRMQGGYFQASCGNGSGGGAVTVPTHRGVQGWAYQNVTGTSSYITGGLFSVTAQGTTSNEAVAISGISSNESTVATMPFNIGTRIQAVNYQTTTDSRGGIIESQHRGASVMNSSIGLTTNTRMANAGGSITTATGLETSVIIDSGSIGTGYGLFIGNVQATSAFGIYQQSSTIVNYFGSKIAIGGGTAQAPVSDLHIDNGNAQSTITIGSYGDNAKKAQIFNNNGKLTLKTNATTNQRIALNVNGNDSLQIDQSGNTIIAGTAQITGLALSITTKTSNYTATLSDYTILADATSNAVTITLPTAVGNTGRCFVIKRIDATSNTVTVTTTSSQTIDGSTTVVINVQYLSLSVQSDGTNWFII